MEVKERKSKELATIIEKIITDVNKKFKQNRNNYKKVSKDDSDKKKASSYDIHLTDDERAVLKLKEKREAEEFRGKLREFKAERNSYLINLCRENNISPDYIIRLGGFNDYDYL